MDTDRELTRIVRSWLRTDENDQADRVLDDVLALLDTTPQHRSWWPARRYPAMNTYAKLAIAAAAVVVVAVIGINLLPGGGGVGGGPAATPSPAPSPTLAPTSSPASSAEAPADFPPAGDLAIDTRHRMTLAGVPITFAVPTSDWVSNGQFGIDIPGWPQPEGAGFIFWPEESPIGVFSDPCASVKAPPVGPSTADLAAAIARIPGTDIVSGPTDVTVGGHPAKQVVIKIREDIACAPAEFFLWYAASADNARYASSLGATMRVWIIDADGTRVQIDGETYEGAAPELGQQIQQIVDSIEFE